MEIIETVQIPNVFKKENIYRILPNPTTKRSFTKERLDRNHGWLFPDEMKCLWESAVSVGGNGGMGGNVAKDLVRLGVGRLIITDLEVFDTSNLNRQMAATKETVGYSKTMATLVELHKIADDIEIIVIPSGINEKTIEYFLDSADVVCDLVEFFALPARLLTHQKAAERNIPIFVCDTVGHKTNLFYFDKTTMHLSEALGLSYDEAKFMSEEEISRLSSRLVKIFAPELPEYYLEDSGRSNIDLVLRRLKEEQKASIVSTNPPIAGGILTTSVLSFLLESKMPKSHREFSEIIKMPGYFSFDAWKKESKIHYGKWW